MRSSVIKRTRLCSRRVAYFSVFTAAGQGVGDWLIAMREHVSQCGCGSLMLFLNSLWFSMGCNKEKWAISGFTCWQNHPTLVFSRDYLPLSKLRNDGGAESKDRGLIWMIVIWNAHYTLISSVASPRWPAASLPPLHSVWINTLSVLLLQWGRWKMTVCVLGADSHPDTFLPWLANMIIVRSLLHPLEMRAQSEY